MACKDCSSVVSDRSALCAVARWTKAATAFVRRADGSASVAVECSVMITDTSLSSLRFVAVSAVCASIRSRNAPKPSLPLAKGYVHASDIEPVIGALLTIGSVVWSVADKLGRSN